MRKWSKLKHYAECSDLERLLHIINLFSQISEEYWCEHSHNIGVNMAKSKAKKETYRERWLREHPRISLYLRRDEYEELKSLAKLLSKVNL
jgi:hypothetical protein